MNRADNASYGFGYALGVLLPFALLILLVAWFCGAFDGPDEPSAVGSCLETARLISGHAPTQAEVDFCVAKAGKPG